MDLDTAIDLLKTAVKHTGTIDQKHIDLTIIPADQRSNYERALKLIYLNMKEGKITKDDFIRRVHLD
jgi:hypothetical protein